MTPHIRALRAHAGGYCEYSAGEAPRLENEVAFSRKIMEANHLEIGDTVTASIGGKERKFIITGYYSDYMRQRVERNRDQHKTDAECNKQDEIPFYITGWKRAEIYHHRVLQRLYAAGGECLLKSCA